MNLIVYFQLLCLCTLQALSKHTYSSDGSCPGKGYEEQPFLKDYCNGNRQLNRFMSTIETLISSDCNLVDACRRVVDRSDDVDQEQVDFIVVGGGAAGPVVADRLSENPAWTVVLLEAGPEQPAATDIPAFLSSAVGTKYDWKYVTAPQQNACLLTGGVCEWPRGKLLGGTVALSGSMYSRGNRHIYDSWLKDGNNNWGYDDVLPVFKMSENNRDYNSGKSLYLHGTKGPIPVSRPVEVLPITRIILDAGKELGYRQIDMSEPEPLGFSLAQIMKNDMEIRETVPTAYIRPHLNRSNLKVKINRYVTKLLVNPDKKTVYGVEYVDTNNNNRTYKLIAKKEVILSGGIIGSTQLLLLSGIGPEEDLKRLGIPLVQNLSVGRNLQHHVSIKVKFQLNVTNHRVLSYQSVFQYSSNNTGPLSTTGALQASAFLKSDQRNASEPADIQLFFDGFSTGCSNAQTHIGCTRPNEQPTTLGIRAVNTLPRSRGTIKLNSPDPFDRPIIDPNYLSEDTDIRVLLWGINRIKELANTKALQRYGAKLLDRTPVKECRHCVFDTEPYWRCYIKYYTSGENHQAGTSKMGPASDPEAVVDDQLRVHNVKGIRVVDASIMPLQPNCNPIAPIVMIAEKAAIYIKNFWKS
ncbi:glucose dehydrogenase [FAD, quinone]-like isoform X2 [Adelges cooleyi]|uniref:glucose dehydrogenase [FAD, quinone]-like isoform X2 n=1 Tax=Adelges cooleyi TaxID=133065 RepID=UPI0021803057|nr:glucose dehydrogenase [FAD, quinone]-like isoform X2 [Adelges cooleyi]